jgi:hypothetical protein
MKHQKEHNYSEDKKYRVSDYSFRKLWFQDENMSFFKCIKARKYSRYNIMRSSAYDSFMIDGLCDNNYFGLDKIKHLRLKYINAIKKR